MKLFKSPERFFSFGMWVVSLLSAWLLIGLGSLLIGDLPKADRAYTLDAFIDPKTLADAESAREETVKKLRALESKVEDAQGTVHDKTEALRIGREQHLERMRQRGVTGDNKAMHQHDDELRQLGQRNEALSKEVAQLQDELNEARGQQRAVQHELDSRNATLQALRQDAQPLYDSAVRSQELRVFGWRLMLTLPLLLVSVWLIRAKRQSTHWPLMRGFILFSLFTFFFELVPYLPSWGGYIRYLVGLILTIFGGHWGIRWMQAYLQRRAEEEKRNELDRRASIDYNAALTKMAASVCPGCERALPAPNAAYETNHCVHCGLKLFDRCQNPVQAPATEEGQPLQLCGVRKNAFFRHCPTCGGGTGVH